MKNTLNPTTGYALNDTLFCFALASEAGQVFAGCHQLITGIGKVNAAYQLSKAIAQRRPKLIVNLGSAGSSTFQRGEIVCCRKFIQRDMDARGLGFELYETPLSSVPTILEYGLLVEGVEEGICGTGDSFEMGHNGGGYNIVDMEGYALALVAMKEQIPFLSLKYITDGADDQAAVDWEVQVHQAAEAFGDLLRIKPVKQAQ